MLSLALQGCVFNDGQPLEYITIKASTITAFYYVCFSKMFWHLNKKIMSESYLLPITSIGWHASLQLTRQLMSFLWGEFCWMATCWKGRGYRNPTGGGEWVTFSTPLLLPIIRNCDLSFPIRNLSIKTSNWTLENKWGRRGFETTFCNLSIVSNLMSFTDKI